MLLRCEIIWTRIGPVIRLWNDINSSETPGISLMLKNLWKHPKFITHLVPVNASDQLNKAETAF